MADREANRRRASLFKRIKILAHMSDMADVQLGYATISLWASTEMSVTLSRRSCLFASKPNPATS